jgi:hypothetical protein
MSLACNCYSKWYANCYIVLQLKNIFLGEYMKKLLFFIVLLTTFAVASVTYALPVGIADTSNQVNLQLTQSWTGTVAGTLNGVGVNWYTGYGFQFTYQGNTIQEPISYCVDPADGSLNAVPYYIESLKSNYGINYLEAAWLISQVMNGNLNTVTAQAAIWEIMFSGYTYKSDSNSDSSTTIGNWVTSAENNYGSLNLTGYYIATSPTNSPSSSFNKGYQDYLFYDGTLTSVPEPTTILLLGLGLIGLAGIRKKLNI